MRNKHVSEMTNSEYLKYCAEQLGELRNSLVAQEYSPLEITLELMGAMNRVMDLYLSHAARLN